MYKHLIPMVASLLALQACGPQQSTPTIAGEDLNLGIAKTCTASKPDLVAANPTATITMSNDGWCAVRVTEKDGQPFQLGLVRARPEHGRVLIQKLGGETRLEYTADDRYTGADRFTVALRSRSTGTPDTLVQVAVTVTMGEQVAAPPPPPIEKPAPAARSRTPARRSR